VFLEAGTKRTFAGAVDWPGWCRSGRREGEALEALAAYGPRYAAVVSGVAPSFDAPADPTAFVVVERLKGGSGTDFGVPSHELSDDDRPIRVTELERHRALLTAGWEAFDAIAAAATGTSLRKGPRGGGRDLDKIVAHVREAEEAYLVQLGSRPPKAAGDDPAAEMIQLRAAILDALSARALGRSPAQPSRARTLWTPRYFVRRAAWHVLDHAWEIEDRSAIQPAMV
jgi:hypothetical protein